MSMLVVNSPLSIPNAVSTPPKTDPGLFARFQEGNQQDCQTNRSNHLPQETEGTEAAAPIDTESEVRRWRSAPPPVAGRSERPPGISPPGWQCVRWGW